LAGLLKESLSGWAMEVVFLKCQMPMASKGSGTILITRIFFRQKSYEASGSWFRVTREE
jgi:hypothetical protein